MFLHFVGLMLGAAGGFASAVIMRRALVLPADEAKVVRGLGPILANVSLTGLVVMWATGLILVWSKWGGIGSLPDMFWVKAIFILSLTIVTGLIHMTYAEIRKGNVAAGRAASQVGADGGRISLACRAFRRAGLQLAARFARRFSGPYRIHRRTEPCRPKTPKARTG